jgi:hypothetical protein
MLALSITVEIEVRKPGTISYCDAKKPLPAQDREDSRVSFDFDNVKGTHPNHLSDTFHGFGYNSERIGRQIWQPLPWN